MCSSVAPIKAQIITGVYVSRFLNTMGEASIPFIIAFFPLDYLMYKKVTSVHFLSLVLLYTFKREGLETYLFIAKIVYRYMVNSQKELVT